MDSNFHSFIHSFFLSFFLLPSLAFSTISDEQELFSCLKKIIISKGDGAIIFKNLVGQEIRYTYMSLESNAFVIDPASSRGRKGFIVTNQQDIYFYPVDLSCKKTEMVRRKFKLNLPFPVKNPYLTTVCSRGVISHLDAESSPYDTSQDELNIKFTYRELKPMMLYSPETLLTIQNMIIGEADSQADFCNKGLPPIRRFFTDRECQFSQKSEFNEVRMRANKAWMACSPPSPNNPIDSKSKSL